MTGNHTTCLLETAIGYSKFDLTNINGNLYDTIFYQYTHCPNTSAIKTFECPKKRLIACFCSHKRAAFIFDAFLCNVDEVQTLAWAKIAAAIIGIILNMIILSVFVQRKNIRSKIGNILFLSQSIVDVSNTVLFAIPTGSITLIILTLYDKMSDKEETTFSLAASVLFFLSFNVSINVFTLIALERHLSLTKPFWHRIHVTKGWITRRLIVVTITAIVITVIQFVSVIFRFIPLYSAVFVIWIVWTFIISILFTFSFIKARRSVKMKHMNQVQSGQQQETTNQ